MTEVAAFTGMVDLAAEALGGRALIASDEFFAEKENMLRDGRGVFIADKYTDRGKWMDGWESRRERVPGHDWCIIALGVRGRVVGVDIDTNHFLGNHPPFASVDACRVEGDPSGETLRDTAAWEEILPEVALKPGSRNIFAVVPGEYTHLRLNILPDGGVARFRAYGEPSFLPPVRPTAARDAAIDLACASNGGRALGCSDMFFSPMGNLILPQPAQHMGGGWESRRRRGAGFREGPPAGDDWIVVQLAAPGVIDEVALDTAFFKGNYPDRAWLDGILWPDAPLALLLGSEHWRRALEPVKLRADRVHMYLELRDRGPFSHVRLHIAPCGGVSRMRIIGRPSPAADLAPHGALAQLNGAAPAEAAAMLRQFCGSRRWVEAMAARRPFASRAALHGAADHVWWRLGDTDWRQAFAAHPQIGGDVDALRERFAASEQAGVAGASEDTLRALAQGNAAYLARYGYIFIVCATGKSAAEMLALLEERLDNPPEAEVRIAAGEQAAITHLRLDKWIDQLESP